MSKNSSNILIALLTGVALGAAAGILFAPDKGSKTRGKIRDGVKDGKKALDDKYDELYEKVKTQFKGVPKDFSQSFDELVSKADVKAEEVIDALEKKLKQLKQNVTASKN